MESSRWVQIPYFAFSLILVLCTHQCFSEKIIYVLNRSEILVTMPCHIRGLSALRIIVYVQVKVAELLLNIGNCGSVYVLEVHLYRTFGCLVTCENMR